MWINSAFSETIVALCTTFMVRSVSDLCLYVFFANAAVIIVEIASNVAEKLRNVSHLVQENVRQHLETYPLIDRL